MRRRKTLWIAGAGALLAATPYGRSIAKSALLLTEILSGRLARPVDPDVPAGIRRLRLELPHGPADLYERPARHRVSPGVVLVHGANRDGIDDPRVRGLAAAFCRAGRTVLAPALALGDRRMDPDDLTRILEAIDALADRTGPVVVVAFSYGGGLTLCALAERPSIQARVRAVATVGTYFDLIHLIQGVTTGQIAVDGALYPWRPSSVGMVDVGPLLAEVLGPEDASDIQAALASGRPGSLSPAAQAAYRVIANRDPRSAETLVAELPAGVRGLLDRLSPARRISAIRVPVFALHSRVDPSAPALESAELVRAVRRRTRARLTLMGSFNHVTPVGKGLSMVWDMPGLVAFGARILRAQERWLPAPRALGDRP